MKKLTFLSAILLCTVWISYGQWTYTNLTEPKEYMGSVAQGNMAYFAGGGNSSGNLSTVEAYNVTTGTMEIISSLTIPRQIISGVSCDSKVFFAGGMDNTVSFSTVDIYDALSQQWTVAQLSVDRFSITSLSWGNKVLFAGGVQFPSINRVATVDIYDNSTGQWTITNLSQGREGIAGAVVGDIAIFAGGITNSGSTDRVDIYNFSTGTWSIDTLSLARGYAAATTLGNKVIIAGGVTSFNNPSDRVDIYDAATNSWTIDSLSEPRSWMGQAATVNGKAYFAGGGIFAGNGFYGPSDIVDIYDGNNWTTDILFNPRVDHSVIAVGDYLIAAGGKEETNCLSTVEIFYDPYIPHIIYVPGDYPTIQHGIEAAEDGDTVLVAEDTYYENINFLGKAILVASEFILEGDTNYINNTIIDGSQPVNPEIGSVVTFTTGEDTTSVLCGFTIAGGTGTYVSDASARAGGGVFIQYSGGKIINNHIEYNQAKYQGWAIGGGICAGGPVSPLPWVVIRNNRINHNKAESTANDRGEGGGVVCFYNLVMTDNVVSDNNATGVSGGLGGGVYIRGDMGTSWFNISRNIVTYNEAVANSPNSMFSLGGGFVIWLSTGIAAGNLFAFNVTESPSGIYAAGSGVYIEGVPEGDLLFENNWILDNSFVGDVCNGGGLSLWSTGGTYQNNVIQNNESINGGGIYIGSSPSDTAILVNNTITGNNAAGNGTGLYISSSNAIIINSILYNNTPPGSAIFAAASSLEVRYSDIDYDAGVYPGEGNINEEPLFQSDGYHLEYEYTNPVVNAGILSVSINGIVYECPPYDIDGEMRPYLNTHPEIGVDEVPVLETGVSVSSSGLFINIYPNPAKDKITIDFPESEDGINVQVSIYGSAGQEMISGNIINSKSEIDISSLAPGLYFLKVENSENISFSKFIKN